MKRDLFIHKSKSWDTESPRVKNAKNIADTIIKNCRLDKNMHILDLGAGTGLLSFFLSNHVNRITALDNSKSMLEVFRDKQDRFSCKSEILYADMENDPIDGKFDAIVSSMTIHHIKDTKKLLDKLRHMLKPGGFIAIADLKSEDGSFHNDNTGVFHKGFDTKELLSLALECGFKNAKTTYAGTIEKPDNSYDVFLLTAYI